MAALQDDLSFDQRSEMRGAFMHVTARFSCDDSFNSQDSLKLLVG